MGILKRLLKLLEQTHWPASLETQGWLVGVTRGRSSRKIGANGS